MITVYDRGNIVEEKVRVWFDDVPCWYYSTFLVDKRERRRRNQLRTKPLTTQTLHTSCGMYILISIEKSERTLSRKEPWTCPRNVERIMATRVLARSLTTSEPATSLFAVQSAETVLDRATRAAGNNDRQDLV